MALRRRSALGAAALAAAMLLPAGRAAAFGGLVRYEGALGPVGGQRPLCVCVYTDAALTRQLGCLILRRNASTYATGTLADRDYYLIAFLDLHINERLDPDEPFEVFADRGAPPGDAVNGRSPRTDVDFVFGDERLGGLPTPPPTASPSPSPLPTATVAAAAPGDCDGDGAVAIDELVRGVAIALATQPLATCPAADRDGDGAVRINELIAALNRALA